MHYLIVMLLGVLSPTKEEHSTENSFHYCIQVIGCKLLIMVTTEYLMLQCLTTTCL